MNDNSRWGALWGPSLHFHYIKLMKYIKVTFKEGEFEGKFPELAKRPDLNDSDRIRLALGFEARNTKGGAPKNNKNAAGNKGRWKKDLSLA